MADGDIIDAPAAPAPSPAAPARAQAPLAVVERFAQPDETEPLRASELSASLGERLGAQAGEALFGGVRTIARVREYNEAESGREDFGSQIARVQAGEDPADVLATPQVRPPIPMADARERVKQAGLDRQIKLPEGADIKAPVLDLMIEHARERQQLEAAVSRGPQGFLPGALGFVTEIGVGMIDPVNIAAFSIPVMGEARLGMLMARAGGIGGRAVLRAEIGAAQGAVGTTLLQPAEWWLHTKDGQDYTLSDALRSVIMGAGMGASFHAGFGAIGDVRAGAAGRPLAGSVEDLRARAVGGDEQAAALLERMRIRPAPAEEAPAGIAALEPGSPRASALEEVPGLTEPGVADVSRETPPIPAAAPEFAPPPDMADPFVRQAAVFDDLPHTVREDVVHAAMADAIDGNLGRAGLLLAEAAKDAPRIAESLDAGHHAGVAAAADMTPSGRAVFADMRGQLVRAGMDDAEADANAALTAARYEARAARLEGAGGTAEDLYRAEGIQVRGPGGILDDELGRMYAQRAREPSPEYQAALEKHNAEVAKFRQAQADYRAQKIGDAEFIAARREFEAATKEYDAAFAAEQSRPAPRRSTGLEGQQDLFGDTAQQSDLVDAAKGRQLFQPPATVPTFYSAVTRAIASARQERASPEQWLATLRNTPGVKAEEIKWLGIEDWLKEQSGPVSRRDVEDYVRANNIDVREVAKGGERPSQFTVSSAGGPARANPIMRFETRAEAEAELARRKADYPAAYHSLADLPTAESRPKFESYVLPGGENYRELLLTLPRENNIAALERQYAEMADAYQRQGRRVTDEQQAEWDRLSAEITAARKHNEDPDAGNFRSSHWDEPNVIAHIRFNDRTIDGKKTLFIEEVQSDWHQAGKRRGYQGEPTGYKVSFLDDDGYRSWSNFATKGEADAYAKTLGEHKKDDVKIEPQRDNLTGRTQVPDAPFKTTWPELALKRMIRYAAENGYEKVAWTPGEVQAERYDLSKHVKEIEYVKNSDGTYKLGVTAANGEGVDIPNGGRMTLSDIENTVGKEIAEKVGKEEGRKYRGHEGLTLEGLDLKVGGEGMKGFYDKILPATVNKLVKKFGGRVEESKLEVPAESALPHDERAEIVERAEGWMGHPQRFDLVNADGVIEGHWPTRAEAELHLQNYNRGLPEATHAVHTLDITPALRKAAIEEGFPLFQREPGGEMRGRITLGDNKAIIDLFAGADKSTFLHETGHLWLDELARDAARENAPQGVRGDMDAVLKWLGAERADAITAEQHETWARGFEQYLASGEAPSEGLRAAFEQFKVWLAAIYRSLSATGEAIAPEIRAVMDRLVATPEQQGERAAAGNVVALGGRAAPRGPRARDPDTFSLLEFIASRGGIRRDDPLISDLRSILGRDNRFVPGFGQLVRAPRQLSTAAARGGHYAPMWLDQAREAAIEAGYLHEPGNVSGGEARTTINTLLEALDREARGSKVYRMGSDRETQGRAFDPDEELHHLNGELDHALRETGDDPLRIDGKLRDRVLEIMQKEGERDPLVAYERAIMEETYYGAETGRNERIPEHIPGWDVPAEPGAAPQAGGPAQGLRVAGGEGPGAAPRATGAGDRGAPERPAGAEGTAAGRPGGADWDALAKAKRPDDEDLAIAARLADKDTPPDSTDAPAKAVSAAQKAAQDADALLADLLPKLTAEEKAIFMEALERNERSRAEQEQIVRDGAACLSGALIGAVA